MRKVKTFCKCHTFGFKNTNIVPKVFPDFKDQSDEASVG